MCDVVEGAVLFEALLYCCDDLGGTMLDMLPCSRASSRMVEDRSTKYLGSVGMKRVSTAGLKASVKERELELVFEVLVCSYAAHDYFYPYLCGEFNYELVARVYGGV